MLAVSGAAHARAPVGLPRKSIRCSLYLLSVAERSRLGALKIENTGEAVREIRQFRHADLSLDAGLPQSDVSSVRAVTSKSITGLAHRIRNTKHRLADRARGLESFYREHGANEISGVSSEWIAGFTIRGKDAILDHLAMEQAIEEQLTGAIGFARMGEALRLVGAGVFYGVTMGSLLQGDSPLTDSLPWMTLFGAGLADAPFVTWASFDLRSKKVEAQFREALEQATPGAWVYDSFDAEVRTESVKSLLEHSNHEALIARAVDSAAYLERAPWLAVAGPRILTKLGLVRSDNPNATSQKFFKKTWVLTDRVLRVDADGVPALSIVVRTSFEKPKRPKSIKQTETVEETEAVLSPVYVPVNNGRREN